MANIKIMDPASAARDGWHSISDVNGQLGNSLNGDIKKIFFTGIPQSAPTSSARQPDDWSCGPYSMAEALNGSGEAARQWLQARGLITSQYGTDHSGIVQYIQACGYSCSMTSGYLNNQMNPSVYQQLIAHLQKGYKAILLMGGLNTSAGGACRNSYWTRAGHYICAYGIDSANSASTAVSDTDYSFNPKSIYAGSTGVEVLLAQEILKARGLYSGSLDRSFGQQTRQAVIQYQQARGLSADGVVGPKTWNDMIAF